jgi:NAD(P)-dependent dehydrogenase (short-subunit alcohol dehydrogenase family)
MARVAAKEGRVILITGCSSGIGEATARRLLAAGHRVVATARRAESLAPLEAAGAMTLALDVTREETMRAAVAAVEQQLGGIDVLVNNAGYSQSGAVEEVPLDAVRRQFETNVFGGLRLAQLVLPGMRRQKWGRIINLSSMGGRLTFPGFGVYHASKYALEALSDALRFEVRGLGVAVVLIEPGLIKSEFGRAAIASMTGASMTGPGAPAGDSPYAAFNAALIKATAEGYEKGPLAALSGTPDDVARVVARAIAARRPRARYTVTSSAKLLLGLRRWLSDPMWDAFMTTVVPPPGKIRGSIAGRAPAEASAKRE